VEKNQILLKVENLKKYFNKSDNLFTKKQKGYIKAVDDVTFDLFCGETLGLVGESGCGKTTVARLILKLIPPTSGSVILNDIDFLNCSENKLFCLRKDIQIIFQDPYASLNPRMVVESIIREPLDNYKVGTRNERRDRVKELLKMVGLSPEHLKRYPHEFSGGQRQRVGIARSLALNPKIIICDEPVSALDVSIQSQILNLLIDLQNKFNLSYIFISHNLSVVKHMSSRIAIMYLGKIVEISSKHDIYSNPIHPYTKALISAIPIPDPDIEKKRETIILDGDVFSQSQNIISGCSFYSRCSIRSDKCKEESPILENINNNSFHQVSCWNYKNN